MTGGRPTGIPTRRAVVLAAVVLSGCGAPIPQTEGAEPAFPPPSALAAGGGPQEVNLGAGRAASASNSLPDRPPTNAVDGEPNPWVAGAHPPQWIQIDLGQTAVVSEVRLTVAQTPPGVTQHELYIGEDADSMHLAYVFRGPTEDGQILVYRPRSPRTRVRYIRVMTVESPSWVAWAEVEVIGSVAPTAASAETTSPAADIVFHNGTILTMEDDQPQAQALAVLHDQILALGSEAEVMRFRGEATQLVDLRGYTLTPGFIDAHQHRLGDLGMLGFTRPEQAIQESLEHGWTGLHELLVNPDRMTSLIALDRAGDLRLRVTGYLQVNYLYDVNVWDWRERFERQPVYSPYLQFPGLKITLDQEWGEQVFFDQETLNQSVADAQGLGWQVATHAFSPQATGLILAAYEAALRGESNALARHRLEHAGIVSDEDLATMARLGIIASIAFTGTPFLPDDASFQQYIAPDLWPWMVRTRDFLAAGIPTAGHTDAPWGTVDWRNGVRTPNPGDPMSAVYSAVTRRDAYWPRLPEPWQLAQTITVDQALRLLTLDAAYASFDENRLGSLRAGKLADLVIVSANPLEVPVDDIPEIQVLVTMVGGKLEYCAPQAKSLCP